MPGMKITRLALTIISLTSFGFCSAQINPDSPKFDLSISNFKYATTMDGMDVYLQNGTPDLQSTKTLSTFSLRPKYNITYESAKGYLNYLKNYEEKHGGTITNVITKDTLINNLKAFLLTMNETFEGHSEKAQHFYAFLLKGDIAIIFLSSDFDNGKYIAKFKKTFYSIHF
jgi:hypothetical protein